MNSSNEWLKGFNSQLADLKGLIALLDDSKGSGSELWDDPKGFD